MCDAGHAISACGFALARFALGLPQRLISLVEPKSAAALPKSPSRWSYRVNADGPDSGLLMRLHGPVDATGGVFGAAALEIVEGLGVVVEVFFGPGGAKVSLVGPFDAIPAVAAGDGSFGHKRES